MCLTKLQMFSILKHTHLDAGMEKNVCQSSKHPSIYHQQQQQQLGGHVDRRFITRWSNFVIRANLLKICGWNCFYEAKHLWKCIFSTKYKSGLVNTWKKRVAISYTSFLQKKIMKKKIAFTCCTRQISRSLCAFFN